MKVLELSAKTGEGLDGYLSFLEARIENRVAVGSMSAGRLA
jgi:hypothetical protein